MSNVEVIRAFYKAFQNGNASAMVEHYHEDVEFSDPAFGILKGEKACGMWHMLLSNKYATPQVTCKNIRIEADRGWADWEAEYLYGPQRRKVVNNVSASFHLEGGKIIRHQDDFNIWKWSSQAIGFSGRLLGWTPFMKNKIKQMANRKLDHYLKRGSE